MIAQQQHQEVTQYILKIFYDGGTNNFKVFNDGSLNCEDLVNARNLISCTFRAKFLDVVCWREFLSAVVQKQTQTVQTYL